MARSKTFRQRDFGQENALRRMKMKVLRIMLLVVFTAWLARVVFAQSATTSDAQTAAQPAAHSHTESEAQSATQSNAQIAFAKLKALQGTWEGKATLNPPSAEMDPGDMQVSFRVTSRGHALVHEMSGKGTPATGTDSDHPITLLYLDGDRLYLTHYCDAGNRPRMVGTVSPDGKKVEFNFLDVSGSTKHGRMDHAVFTIIDADHHVEDWTYEMPGDKKMVGHMELQRVK